MSRRIQRNRRRGVSAVEMAFVAPVFLTLVLGIIESSRLGMVTQLLTTAAREGCRVAVLNGMEQTDVQNRVDAVLKGSGIPVGTVAPTCPSPYAWDTSPGGTPITVNLTVPYTSVSWLPVPLFLGGVNITCSATMSSERP
jgi:Flp pilus assembly protein TadG